MRNPRAAVQAIVILLLSACSAGGSAPPVIGSSGAAQGGGTPALSFPSHYTLLDLGAGADPTALNANGAVAGTIHDRAFISSSGFTIVYGTLNGAGDSSATGLNDAGIAVGTSGGHGAAFEPGGAIVDLGAIPNSFASDLSINNADQIVGISPLAGIAGCGGALTSFSLQGAPASIGPTVLSAKIDNSGTIAAAIYDQSGGACAGTIAPALFPGATALSVPSTFTLDSQAGSMISDINDAGVVIGWSPTASGAVGTFVLTQGKPGTAILPTAAQAVLYGLAINNNGWIVGSYTTAGRAFAYVSGKLIDLNSVLPAGCAAWTLTSATGINDAGDIAGVGTIGGVSHGFLLIPAP